LNLLSNTMKKLIICVMLSATLWSCKKSNDPHLISKSSDLQKSEVTFNISDFSQKVEDLSKTKESKISSVSLKSVVAYLSYIVYDLNGNEVSRIKQDSLGNTTRIFKSPSSNHELALGKKQYGCIRDSLSAGTYTVIMAASNTFFEINRRTANFEFQFYPLNEAYLQYMRGADSYYRTSDTYFKKISITVSKENLQTPVVLDRIVGKIDLTILDAKADTKYRVIFENENEAYKFSNETPYGDLSLFLPKDYKGPNTSYFILNTMTPVTVRILYSEGDVKMEKKIVNVKVFKNKRTILTGNLHKAVNAGFNVNVNNKFDDDATTVEF